MFSKAKNKLEAIKNNNLTIEERNKLIEDIILLIDTRKNKINNYNKKYYQTKRDNEPKQPRKPHKPHKPHKKKPIEDKKTNNMIEYRKQYYLNNKEQLKEKIKEYRTANKEKYNEYHKNYQNEYNKKIMPVNV